MSETTKETAIFAEGCFWCTEAVFNRLKGVKNVVPGYIGGTIKNPCYREICTGKTGHAEAIKIDFDSSIVSFEELLEIFFATHNPTTLNQQGGDKGTQYRSEIFYTTEKQKELSEKYIEVLTKNNVFDDPIVTAISEAKPFYLAEVEHHEYYDQNSSQPFCQMVISPKIDKLQNYFKDKLK